VSYDLSTSEYRDANGKWFFLDGYPYDTESLYEFQKRIVDKARSELIQDNKTFGEEKSPVVQKQPKKKKPKSR